MQNKILKKHKILLTGGGTGGHVLPILAIITELKKFNSDILYIGSGNEIENKIARNHKIKYKKIMSGKLRRYFSWQNFLDFFKVIIGFFQSFFIILSFNPDIIFSKGGYVGLPLVYAGWILGKPIYAHETDSILGLANRMSLNKCKKIFVSFPIKYYRKLPVDKIFFTGNPISEKYKYLREKKYFKNNKKTILVTGGSQGSHFINKIFYKILPELCKKYNIIHICGKNDYEWLKSNNFENYLLYDYTNEFSSILYNSDLVISRSGGTIFEIAYCAKPTVLIPLDGSANNHQNNNAEILLKENAAVVLHEKELTSESLLEIINRIMENKELRKELSSKINQFSQKEASKVIAENILNHEK